MAQTGTGIKKLKMIFVGGSLVRPLVNILVSGALLTESDLLDVLRHSGDISSSEEFYKVRAGLSSRSRTFWMSSVTAGTFLPQRSSTR
jgi:hypothetical protein